MHTFRQTRRQSRPRRSFAVRPARLEADRAAVQEALGYPVRAKLKAGAPDDAHEREADALADRIVAAPPETLQRQSAAAAEEDERARRPLSANEPQKEEEVHRKTTGGKTTLTHATAAAISASRGGGQPLPAGERAFFESRLGGELATVRVHADAEAARLAARLSARAFTAGTDVYFANGRYRADTHEGRFLLAHELTHVAQQRRGVRVEGGLGRPDDTYERQADAVAERVARGERAAEPGLATAGSASPSAPLLQRFAEVVGKPYDRLSDDGKMAVKDHTRHAWAESLNITRSNHVLDGLKSKVKIEELSGNDLSVAAPGKTAKNTLKKFRMINRVGGGETELVDDCGGAAQQILGSPTHGYESFVGVTKRGTAQEYTAPSQYQADDNAKGGLVSTTERMSGEIYIRLFKLEFNRTLNRADALKEWAKLSAAQKRRLSQKYGLNQYAVPRVGQGITIGSERDMPGASETGYNFHFGFNLVASGQDYITLEDYDSSGVKYYFDMYGPRSKGQSWAQAASNVNAVDDKFTVMVVQHPESLKGKINTANVYFEDDPAKPTGLKKLENGTRVVILRQGVNWMKVEVKSGPRAGQSGWIMSKYYTSI